MSKHLLLVTAIAISLLAPTAAQAGTFTPVSTSKFKLVSHGFGTGSSNQITELSKTYPQVGLGGVLAHTNRFNEPLMKSRAPAGAFGYSWKSTGSLGGDNGVDYWTPQGITGDGGGAIQAVSWYRGEPGHETSVRVAFVNRNESTHGKYRFALLVDPTGGSHFAQIKRHAGGIAWVGPYLYMADTHYGIQVFDMTRALRVPKNKQGGTGGYGYLLPKIGSYQRSGGGKLLFSALALDRSNAGAPAIVAGEYRKRDKEHPALTRIARWPINGDNRVGRSQASQAWHTTLDQLQGVITHNGRVFVSSTQGAGVLYHGLPGKTAQADPWGKGPEGLYAENGRLWTLTEARKHRTVFGKTFASLN